MRESIFKKVFFQGCSKVSYSKWFRYLLLELYLGENLIDMLANTASYNRGEVMARMDSETNGWRRSLEDFIPATVINNLLKNHILFMIKAKYVNHYGLVRVVKEDYVSHEHSSMSDERYELDHKNIHLLTELRITYNTVWVLINGTIDVIVYIVTQDIVSTLLAGALIEFIRRFKF